MTGVLRRGACPSLSAPMATGDGLLVRLNPRGGVLRPRQAQGIAEAARRYGKGILEITSRGSLQIRGLTSGTTAPFTAEVETLGIDADEGVEIKIGALAGRDANEVADPGPLAGAIREGLENSGMNGRLAPKVSVLVDGGGALGLGALPADVRLEAVGADGGPQWRIAVGGSSGSAAVLGQGDAATAVKTALDCLAVLGRVGSAARARDLRVDTFAHVVSALDATTTSSAASQPIMPVGEFVLNDGLLARGFALPFGQIIAEDFEAFATELRQTTELRLAPGRGLLLLGLSGEENTALTGLADRLGFVTEPDDPRLRVAACAGTPACASAHLPTKEIAAAIVAERPDLLTRGPMLHISGCAKKCARPTAASIALVGSPFGCDVEGEGTTADADVRLALLRLAERFAPGKRRSA